ncbi:MAG: ChpI protein [Bryobacteraceae bacterium]
MKTAVSLPDPLFHEAEAAARESKVSRSQFYANAIEEFLRRRRADAITAQMNALCAQLDTSLDPALEQAQLEVLARERW